MPTRLAHQNNKPEATDEWNKAYEIPSPAFARVSYPTEANRNTRWANVLRILTLFGLRPIELQYLTPNTREDGSLGLWCSYEKTCGGSQTAQRQEDAHHWRCF